MVRIQWLVHASLLQSSEIFALLYIETRDLFESLSYGCVFLTWPLFFVLIYSRKWELERQALNESFNYKWYEYIFQIKAIICLRFWGVIFYLQNHTISIFIVIGGSGYCKYGWSKYSSPSGRSATFLVRFLHVSGIQYFFKAPWLIWRFIALWNVQCYLNSCLMFLIL